MSRRWWEGATLYQAADGSVLRLTQRLCDLRRRAFGRWVASYEQIPAAEPVWLHRSGPLLVAANLGDDVATLAVPGSGGAVALSSRRDTQTGPHAPELVLARWEAVVIENDAREGDVRG